jgi:hypothetical protein
MTDDELAAFCGIAPDDPIRPKFFETLTPQKRATYERMATFTSEWNLYVAGLGPRPTGALVDTDRSTNRRKGWR